MDEKKTREEDALKAAVRSGSERDAAAGGAMSAADATLSEAFDDLPEICDETRIVLLPVSPFRVHAYWVIGSADLDRSESRIGERGAFSALLRLQEMADEQTERANGPEPVDVRIVLEAGSHYVQPCRPGRLYVAQLGFVGEDGRFEAFSRSNVVRTPFAEPAPKEEETPRPIAREHATEEARAMERVGELEPSPRPLPSMPALTAGIPAMGENDEAGRDEAAKGRVGAIVAVRAEAKVVVEASGTAGGAGLAAEMEDGSEGEGSKASPGVATTSVHPSPEELLGFGQAVQVRVSVQPGPPSAAESTILSPEKSDAEPPTIRRVETLPDLTEMTEKAFLYGVSSEHAAKG
jgi:hypothetical protein